MNKFILDGCIQKDVKIFDKTVTFNISSQTGIFKTIDNKLIKRYTYIKVVYPDEIGEYLESILQPGIMIRIYGKLDSEQYTTQNNKHVYNKILKADKIMKIRWDPEIQEYVEVL